MILTLDNLHHYLLENGTLEPESLIDGSYTAAQARTRNVTFNVTRRSGKNLFVKQLAMFDPQNTYILQKDATCLWLIKNEPAFKNLSAYVPDYFGYDTSNQVLITEFLPDARNLENFFRFENKQVNDYVDKIAPILASFHFPLDKKTSDLPSMRFFQKQLPWALSFGTPDSASQYGNSPVINQIVNNPDYKAMLRDARNMYTYTSLIHGDIKWMNFLVSGQTGEESIKLIDWEIADIGDPLWDVGGLFMSVIMLEAVENPYQKKEKQAASKTMAQLLEPCWPVMGRLWKAYCAECAFDFGKSDEAFSRALHFAGARLIQTAVEFNMHGTQVNPATDNILNACITLFTHRQHILDKALATQTGTSNNS